MNEELENQFDIDSLEENVKSIVKEESCNYIDALIKHIETRFGGMKIKDIPPEDLKELVDGMSTPLRQRLEEEFSNINLLKKPSHQLPL